MPHDKEGRLVELGDWVKYTVSANVNGNYKNVYHIGRVCSISPSCSSCNAQATYRWAPYAPESTTTFTCHEAELVLKHDGSEVVPVNIPVPGHE